MIPAHTKWKTAITKRQATGLLKHFKIDKPLPQMGWELDLDKDLRIENRSGNFYLLDETKPTF